MRKVKLFTHTDLDGVGCAVLAYLFYGKENVDVEYCGYNNVNDKVKEFLANNEYMNYDTIFITDISVSEEVANDINNLYYIGKHKVRLFDHHATALWLNAYPWAMVAVENEETGIKTSGTELFYEHLRLIGYFDQCFRWNVKRFIEVVRDYDTWRWKEVLGDKGIKCKQVNDLLYIYGRDEFIEWAIERVGFGYSDFPIFNGADVMVLAQKQKDIDNYIALKDHQLVELEDKFGYKYGLLFAERYFSELGNKLCELHPELDYVAMIDIGDGKVSFRCTREGLDLGGEIAHSFGGGGHKKAAGSTFNVDLVRDLVISEVLG